MFNNIRGIVRFHARGTKLYSFINAVRENHIVCTAQECRNEEYCGQIYFSSLKKLQELAQQYNIELVILKQKGIIFKVKRYRYRFGIPAGILICLSFIFYISNIVITIDVTGNSEVSSEQILSTLDDVGISKGKFIPDIDFGLCERKLKISIDDLAWVGIRRSGSRLVVDVDETVHSPEMVSGHAPCNIISTKDAQITSVKVYCGSLNHIMGDGVRAGDILVSGVYPDSKGNILKLHAIADIIGVYSEKMTFEQLFEEEIRVSEKEKAKKSLDFFAFRLPLYIGKESFEDYDYSENTNYFMVFDKKLPIGIVHSTYTPYSKTVKNYTEEEAINRLEEKMSIYETNFYSDSNIKNKEVNRLLLDDRIKYEVTYTIEGSIGETSEVFIKK